MKLRHGAGLLLVGLILALVSACVQPSGTAAYPVSPTYYYVVPTITYLRSCPSYGDECPVVSQVYSGDRLLVLDRNNQGWARVQLDRSGAVGWIYGDLITPSPVPSGYYVAWTSVYLRDCADYNCRSVELLHRGNRVDRIDEDYRGWWRVRVVKTGLSGWVPAAAMATTPGPPYFYVAVDGLALRAGPSTGNSILTTLSLNSRVEMLGMNAGGWSQVRDLRTDRIGWAASRYLESFPVTYSRPVPRKRPAAKKEKAEPAEEEQAPAPAAPVAPAPATAPAPPKAM
ncbi:MAG: SH3 domain-containing protein [Desulfobaccales bacterium]